MSCAEIPINERLFLKGPVICFDSYWAIFRLCMYKILWNVCVIQRVCCTLFCICNCMQPDNVLMWVATRSCVWRLCIGIFAHTNRNRIWVWMSRAWCWVTDLYISDILRTHRRLPQYWRHCLYISHDHPRWQFRRRRVFRRRPQFFLRCWCVHTCTWCTETHSNRNFSSQSVWVALSRPRASKPRPVAAFVCYVYCLP
jgi:hypothetical protein